MNKKLGILVAVVLSVGLLGNAYAHKSQVIDNYKFEVGWDKEPPIAGKSNNVVVMVSEASGTDKKMTKEGNVKKSTLDADATKQGTKKYKKSTQSMNAKIKPIGITGLADTLEVDITLNGQKTFLNLAEDKKKPGTYYGEYYPQKEGYPIVHLYGEIDKKEYEITFHPEKIVSSVR